MLLFHINAHVRVKVHARIYIRLRVCEAQYIFKIWNQSKLVFSLSPISMKRSKTFLLQWSSEIAYYIFIQLCLTFYFNLKLAVDYSLEPTEYGSDSEVCERRLLFLRI